MRRLRLQLIAAFAATIALAAPAAAMSFVMQGTAPYRWVYAHGDIGEGDAVKLDTLLRQSPKVRTIVFDSRGGALYAALRIGHLVRRDGLATLLPKGAKCLSACFFAFTGGVRRTVQEGAALGVHRFSGTVSGETADGAQSVTQAVVADLFEYLREMGVDGGALTAALLTSSQQIHVFTPSDMAKLHVTTPVVREEKDAARGDGVVVAGPGFKWHDPMRLYH